MKKKPAGIPSLTFWKNRLDESKLGCYVYGIGDPESKRLFYIGKGGGKKGRGNNRPDAHLVEAYDARKAGDADDLKDPKIAKINQIWDSGKVPTLTVIRRNLSEEVAFDVEAAVMETLSVVYGENLSNEQGGHHSEGRGIITEESFGVIFAEPVAPTSRIESVFIFNISRTFEQRGLYEAVRASWKIRERNCVLPAYGVGLVNGISRVVVKIESWHPGISNPKKKSFRGVVLDENAPIGGELIGKDFSRLIKNPKSGKPLGYFQRGGVICVDFMGGKKARITRGLKESPVLELAPNV